MDDKRFWIGFNLIKGIGAVRMQGLIAYFGELESAWKAVPAELAAAGLGLKVIERVIQARESVDLEKVWEIREEEIYPKLFGLESRGIFTLSPELF